MKCEIGKRRMWVVIVITYLCAVMGIYSFFGQFVGCSVMGPAQDERVTQLLAQPSARDSQEHSESYLLAGDRQALASTLDYLHARNAALWWSHNLMLLLQTTGAFVMLGFLLNLRKSAMKAERGSK